MGKEGGCEPGTMVLMSRVAKQFYRRGDEYISSMPVGTAGEVTSTELYEVVAQTLS